MRLKDKVILVTASTRGIGLAIVKACAKEGGIVYRVARFHIYEPSSWTGKCQRHTMPVLVYYIVVYAFSFVILQIFQPDIKGS